MSSLSIIKQPNIDIPVYLVKDPEGRIKKIHMQELFIACSHEWTGPEQIKTRAIENEPKSDVNEQPKKPVPKPRGTQAPCGPTPKTWVGYEHANSSESSDSEDDT